MAREVIINLYNMGYRIILFSNNCCLVDSWVDEEINKHIEHIYYSYDMGHTKSDKESYQIIINDCLMRFFILEIVIWMII